MDEPEGHHAKGSKPDMKTESELVVSGAGEGNVGNNSPMGTGFYLGMMKCFEVD